MATAEVPTTAEGYDPDFFLKKVSDRLICPVCHLVMAEPWVVVDCGHHFCRSCLDKVKESTGLCPLDRENIGQTYKDRGKWREIQGLKRRCVKSEEGCDWTGELRDFEDHIVKKQCFLHCINGCGNKVRSFEMQEHVDKACPETMMDCPYKIVGDGCDFRAKRAKINSHMKSNQVEHSLCAATAWANVHQYIWKEATQPTKPEDRKTTFDWIIYDFAKKKQEEVNGKVKCQVSEKFYTGPCNTGYCIKLKAHLNGSSSGINTHVSVYAEICRGRNDDLLSWPFCHNITLQVIDSKTNTVATKLTMIKRYYALTSRLKPIPGKHNPSHGFPKFLPHDKLSTASTLSTDCLHIRCIVDWSPW